MENLWEEVQGRSRPQDTGTGRAGVLRSTRLRPPVPMMMNTGKFNVRVRVVQYTGQGSGKVPSALSINPGWHGYRGGAAPIGPVTQAIFRDGKGKGKSRQKTPRNEENERIPRFFTEI
ncbi:hypothetical protein EYF80_037137 [Liparis tanakae]|uniref:Uncharacterized protein n=1 Tax=Liparis tanakae TaxID=230148 RepID=A0A4Z2GGT2_9TELE|nr:hypothetical protein EYF80_037137 [Liparis tanakae]